MSKPKIIICINSAWNLVNFRTGLIKSLIASGYEVVAVAPDDAYSARLAEIGCRYIPIAMDNQGTNPVRDALLVCRFIKLFLSEKPDAYLGYTVKPNVYGSMAAHLLGIPVVNNIAGLGSVFIKNGWQAKLVRQLYWLGLSRSATIFFQNDDDRQQFIAEKIVNASKTELLPGSGIDLRKFNAEAVPEKLTVSKPFRFILIARMLWDKGVGEYVEAARLLREQGLNAEVCLLGFVDVQNPSAISKSQMDTWTSQGYVRYLGSSDDVRKEISSADCVVLPSYREGTPRTLLEAAAMGKPIITTDAIGCREVVDDGINGFLCKVRDAVDLAEKMKSMLLMSEELRQQMGANGRKKMEREFDEQIVINKYLAAVKQIVS